jgi:uncharacterized membrane protein YgdD (TMEM256/DUF423 family)
MNKSIRWIARCVIITWLAASVALFGAHASATAFSTDQSDLWWNPSESGWGMQLVQRGSVIFVTMFVYDANRNPIWYTATLVSTGNLAWSGDLYVTSGPWFGTAPFDPATVTLRKVGTLTWNGTSGTSGILAYSVDGVAVTKSVVRQTLVVDNFSGTYVGAIHFTTTGCTDPSNNVSADLPLVTMAITQAGLSATMVFSILSTHFVTATGALSQSGQFGSVIGTYTGGDEVGNAIVSAMNVQINGISASLSFNSTNIGCTNVGYYAGIRQRP